MRTPFTRRQQKVVLAALLTALVAISGTRVMGTRFIAKMTNPPLVAPATRPLPAPTTDPQVPTVPPLATPPELPLPPANVAPSPPTGVTPTARPISLCLAKPLTCVLSPQLKEAFKHDRKHTYPITLTWPLIQGASRYVAELTPLWSRTPVVTLESASYCRTVNERELPPGAYEWTVAVYDSRGQCLGSIEPSDPLRVFAVQDSRPIRSNGKAALLDLRASKGTIDAWGSCNHAQYMIVELLQQAGFAVDVNPNQPLSSATLAHTDLLICSYHWVRPRFNPFSPEEIAAIRDFVQAGGGLLLTASGGGNMASYADPLLQEFGCALDRSVPFGRRADATPAASQNVVQLDCPLPILWPIALTGRGMTAVMEADGHPVAEVGRFGRGKIVVAGIGMTLVDCHLRATEPGDPAYVKLFYDFVRYLTGVNCERSGRQEFARALLGA